MKLSTLHVKNVKHSFEARIELAVVQRMLETKKPPAGSKNDRFVVYNSLLHKQDLMTVSLHDKICNVSEMITLLEQ